MSPVDDDVEVVKKYKARHISKTTCMRKNITVKHY